MFNVTFPALSLKFKISRIALSIGNFNIYWYGICITIGMAVAVVYFFRNAKNFGIDPDDGTDVIIAGTIAAIIGARLYYILFSPYPFNNFFSYFNLREGGIAIYGAIIGAFIVGPFVCRFRRVPLLPMMDMAAIGFAIGQGIGRWGNFFNQEAFGVNTTSILGMKSERTYSYLASVSERLAQMGINVDPTLPVHPTFLYESFWCILIFTGLVLYTKHRRFNGELFLLYMALYGAERAVVEGLRADSLLVGSIRTSQLLALIFVVISVGVLIYLYTNASIRERDPFYIDK